MNNALATQQDFSGTGATLAVVETASTAIAAQSKAMVESRYIMAMRNPRNWDQVRQDLIKECRRPTFAHNKSAFYVKPIGQGVEGLGIRFVEVALRCMKNVLVETTMIFEDETKEVHRVSVTDLEANITYPLDVRVSKTVERSKPNSDGSYLSVRKNSYNKDVYTVLGTDDDLLNKRGALISKAIRTIGLRIIPGDLCDEAESIIKRIRLDEAARDPDAERKKIVDAFADIGVSAGDLNTYLGHDLGKCSPAQIVTLRGIYGAIKDGEATWQSVMQNKADQGGAKQGGDGSEKQTFSEAEFATEFPKWQKLIESGKKTVDQVVIMAQSRAPLSQEQEAKVRACKKATAQATGAAPASYAEVADALHKAGDVETLDLRADKIRMVADEAQRTELSTLYRDLRAKLEG